uniref:Uncharacterized protein n=1 Tax=Panagrolaimus superbus TaxID=310955 RepID=A0A914YQ19_9BILA
MLSRTGQAAVMILRAGEHSQARLIQTSSVALRDKPITEQMKEGANNLAEKAKEKVEEYNIIHITDKVKDSAQQVKEKAKKYTDKAGQKIERAGEDIQRKV